MGVESAVVSPAVDAVFSCLRGFFHSNIPVWYRGWVYQVMLCMDLSAIQYIPKESYMECLYYTIGYVYNNIMY